MQLVIIVIRFAGFILLIPFVPLRFIEDDPHVRSRLYPD